MTHWFWKASLISHLSVVIPKNPFSSLEELLASSYQLTILGSSSYQIDFEGAESGPFYELWRTKFLDPEKSLTASVKEGIPIILDSHYTQYVDYGSAKNFKEYHECKLKIANLFSGKSLLGFAFQKNSPFLPVVNARLQSMFESGEVMKIIVKHSKDPPNCHANKGKPLGFENISLVFIIISLGVLASGVICGVEWGIKRHPVGELHMWLFSLFLSSSVQIR